MTATTRTQAPLTSQDTTPFFWCLEGSPVPTAAILPDSLRNWDGRCSDGQRTAPLFTGLLKSWLAARKADRAGSAQGGPVGAGRVGAESSVAGRGEASGEDNR